jgi:hypothetical protein
MKIGFAPPIQAYTAPNLTVANGPVFGKQTLLNSSAQREQVQDTVEIPKAEEEGFSLFRAGKKFLAGLISPVTKIINHPIKAALGIAAGVIIGTLCPVTVPLMFIAGGLFAGHKLLKGVYNAVSNYSQGNMRAAEDAFYDMGEGTSGLGLTLLGTRKAALAAAEAKASVTGADAALAGEKVSGLGFFGKVKEIFSIFSKEGIHAVWKNLVDPVKTWAFTNRGQLAPLIKSVIGLIPGLNSIPGLTQVVDPALNALGTIPDCPMMNMVHLANRQMLGATANPDHATRHPVNRFLVPNGRFVPSGMPGYGYSLN